MIIPSLNFASAYFNVIMVILQTTIILCLGKGFLMSKKCFCFLLSFTLICSNLIASAIPEFYSDGVILIEPTTNTILYSKNMNETFYPASTTKILTALAIIEDLPLNTLITKTQDSVNSIPPDSSHIGLAVGDVYTALDGLYAVLLGSDNFVCHDLAIKDSGSIAAFADRMNSLAKSVGANSSHFVNPHGYHDEDHYTTPYDLSQIAKAAFAQPLLAKISGTATYTFPILNKNSTIPLKHSAPLFKEDSPYYNTHVTSAKTGYHTPAGRTLVAKASYNNIDLIGVVMRADAPYQFEDMNKLFEYGAENYSLSTSESGTYISNHSYSKEAEPFIKYALDNGWITNTTTNYTKSISKRDFITLLKKAIPAQYHASLNDMIHYDGNSIYKENLNLSKKEVAKIAFDFLTSLNLTDLPLQTTVTDLASTPTPYQDAISFCIATNILSTRDDTFLPDASVSYEEAIQIIYQLNGMITRYDSYMLSPISA